MLIGLCKVSSPGLNFLLTVIVFPSMRRDRVRRVNEGLVGDEYMIEHGHIIDN